ncbi:hypothetical protein M409DRAFT_18039 [Zasmidium cellare ATCC 36951]|uniref:SnoaL-like domain-containing protein n=1 Tax=Zasmidium cellare ATCC 36951 TaxID=1080233 RepID=A0A6A6D2E9_ZASCE|nr:uncharacterized protein M409DRAFT_18039 [Zasmidium cellare ATCC 36951]KAF2171806.1 hypothetical protein M409DRAFT_18039 [Zasmidium cellare ATCC 36951]
MSKATIVQVSPTDKPPSDLSSLTEYLESLVTASIDGLNTRTLSTSHLWSFVADDFTSSGMGFAATSKKALEDDYVVYREQFPDHRLEIESMTTTLNSRLITGHVYANVLVAGGHGVPIGMSRNVVMVFEFQKCEGRWWLKATTSLPGEGGVLE